MRVRDATPADGRAIAEVQVVSWRAAYSGLLDEDVLEGLDAAALAKGWADGIAAPDSPQVRYWVFEEDDSIVGYTRFGPSRDEDLDPEVDAEVYGFYTRPDAWGTGIAASSFERILDSFRGGGFTSAYVWAAEGNARGRRFYAKQGFELDTSISARRCFGTPEIRHRRLL